MQGVVVVGLAPLIVDVGEHDLPVSLDVGAVRITLHAGEVVVLAMDGHPFPRRDAREHPGTDAHDEGHRRMELDSLVRQDAVQVDSGDQSSHLSKPHPYQYSHYIIHTISPTYAPDSVPRILRRRSFRPSPAATARGSHSPP